MISIWKIEHDRLSKANIHIVNKDHQQEILKKIECGKRDSPDSLWIIVTMALVLDWITARFCELNSTRSNIVMTQQWQQGKGKTDV
jgi:hypothetical protein